MNKAVNKNKVDPRFKDLIGERVQCIDKDGNTVVGVLYFAGINKILHGKFQVTIGRCPVWPVDPNTLKIYDNDKV